MAETLDEKLGKQERAERKLLQLFHPVIQSGDNMYVSDFFLIGVLKRAISLSSGFRALIAARNFTCAASLLRMQLDTAMRLNAAALSPNAADFALAVFRGDPVNKMKDRDGQSMTDSYLAKKLNELFPWVHNVYKETSELVHFTSRHIFSSAAKLDEDSRTVHFMIGPQDPPRPDEDYFEVVHAFYEATRVVATLAASWQASIRPDRGFVVVDSST
jgi:hypothetical protein